MGVPRLFPWTRLHYPAHVKSLQEGAETPLLVNGMYIDANALLHRANQVIRNYGEHKSYLMDPYAQLTEEQKDWYVYALFFNHLLEITKIVQPTDLLFIGLDGTAPIAKQNQQRQRRFMSSQRQHEDGGSSDTGDVDTETVSTSASNQITPGTAFMVNLSEYLRLHIRKEMDQPMSHWHKLKVIYSPPSTPQEGEHKLLAWIRKVEAEMGSTQKFTHCLMSPDADLLILSMTSYAREIYWLRPDTRHLGYYDIVEVGPIGLKMAHELNLAQSAGKAVGPQRLRQSAIQHFAFIGFFVGNDFLPRVQMFWSLEEGLDTTFNLLREQLATYGPQGLIVQDNNVYRSGLQHLIDAYAAMEVGHLTAQATDPKKHSDDPQFTNHTLMNAMVVNAQGKTVLDVAAYRQAYYQKAGIDLSQPGSADALTSMCHDYIKTLIWVYRYYTDRVPSWTWFYPYHYAPLMMDLSVAVASMPVDEHNALLVEFVKGRPSHPFQQLLSVLPPSDAGYLPRPYTWWMQDPESPLVEAGYFPSSFPMDCEGKFEAHQCLALLPFLDPKVMRVAHETIVKELSDVESDALTYYHIEYQHQEERRLNYSNKYGRLNDIQVVRTYVDARPMM